MEKPAEAPTAARPVLAPTLRTARVVALAFASTIGLLLVLTEVLRASGIVRPSEGSDVVRYAFLVLAVLQALLIRPLQGVLVSPRPPGTVPAEAALVATAFTSSLLSFALAESVAIYGFVLFCLTGERTDAWPFFALSAILLALHFPREERWEGWMRRMSRSPG